MQLAYLDMVDKAEQKSEFYTDISQSHHDTTKSFPSTEPTISDTSWALIREGAKDVNETLNSTDDHCGSEMLLALNQWILYYKMYSRI